MHSEILDQPLELNPRHRVVTWVAFGFLAGMAVTFTWAVLWQYGWGVMTVILVTFPYLLPVYCAFLLIRQHLVSKLVLQHDGIKRLGGAPTDLLRWTDVTRVAENQFHEGGIRLWFRGGEQIFVPRAVKHYPLIKTFMFEALARQAEKGVHPLTRPPA